MIRELQNRNIFAGKKFVRQIWALEFWTFSAEILTIFGIWFHKTVNILGIVHPTDLILVSFYSAENGLFFYILRAQW